ncbi:winged helix-turn-helix transcriptional regulator [Deferribacteraceae bacterium V6Fe1]|nr:winged helix-turn-helix transcriptional regulator [Deferribacteraceae bacterium V6Fe1]
MDEKWLNEFAEKLKVLGHPARLKMVIGLMENECNVSKICDGLKIPQATTSQHISLLKSKGILEGRRDGTTICYKLADEAIEGMLKKLLEITGFEIDCK